MTLGETLPHSPPAEPIVLLGETQGSWLKQNMDHVLLLGYKTNFSFLQNFFEILVSRESRQDIWAAAKEDQIVGVDVCSGNTSQFSHLLTFQNDALGSLRDMMCGTYSL